MMSGWIEIGFDPGKSAKSLFVVQTAHAGGGD
jgi:hypothetical protein